MSPGSTFLSSGSFVVQPFFVFVHPDFCYPSEVYKSGVRPWGMNMAHDVDRHVQSGNMGFSSPHRAARAEEPKIEIH